MSVCTRRPDGRSLIVATPVANTLRRRGVTPPLIASAWKALAPAQFGPIIRTELRARTTLGPSLLVETPPCGVDEPVWFCPRFRRPYPSSVVAASTLPETNLLALIAEQVHGQEVVWRLRTAHFGPLAPPDFWDVPAILRDGWTLTEVMAFWARHAFARTDDGLFAPHAETLHTTLYAIAAHAARRLAPPERAAFEEWRRHLHADGLFPGR